MAWESLWPWTYDSSPWSFLNLLLVIYSINRKGLILRLEAALPPEERAAIYDRFPAFTASLRIPILNQLYPDIFARFLAFFFKDLQSKKYKVR